MVSVKQTFHSKLLLLLVLWIDLGYSDDSAAVTPPPVVMWHGMGKNRNDGPPYIQFSPCRMNIQAILVVSRSALVR